MPRAEKTSIGILFGRPNFILQESFGQVSEAIIENINGKTLKEEFFTEFALQQGTNLKMRSKDGIKIFHIDAGNLIYTKDCYKQAHTVDWNETKEEFTKLWNIVKKTVKLLEIRRIGIVSEYRISVPENNQSEKLLREITKLPAESGIGKFTLSYETRYPTDSNAKDEIQENDFINVIEQFYDSSLDAQHSEDGYINVTLDVQHYFGPVTSANKCLDELTKLYGQFLKYEEILKQKLDRLGFLNGN